MRKKFAILGIVLFALILLPVVAFAAFYQTNFGRVEGDYFYSDGVKTHYTVEGKGEPVILVHGVGGDADVNWRKPGIIDALAQDYQVIAFDNRGHGLSDKPHSVEAYGENLPGDIVRLMDHLHIDKAHVIGYSMGSFITRKFVEMYPERLLSAAPCGMGWFPANEENLALIERTATSLEEGNGLGPLIARFNNDPDLSNMSNRILDWALRFYNDTYALGQLVRGFPALQVAEETLRNNKVPMLTIVGTGDTWAEGAGAMAEITANHYIVWVEGASHECFQRPEFIQALQEFLADPGRILDEGKTGTVLLSFHSNGTKPIS
ncbi:MAG: hypothetical protein RLZZ303_3332 [Candidatus Hydrogenedentota bacterium]|jgi:pimeloyl-ACP methyl ester carboxylesterase